MSRPVYLDHAATSFPKPSAVVSAVTDCMKYRGGNPGRSSHTLALEAAREIYACREVAAGMFGAEADRVIFTLNTTHALNLAIKGILGRGGHALCSDMEHNSVYRPLYRLAQEGIIRFDVFDTFPASPLRTDSMILSFLASKLRPEHPRRYLAAGIDLPRRLQRQDMRPPPGVAPAVLHAVDHSGHHRRGLGVGRGGVVEVDGTGHGGDLLFCGM